MVEFRKEAIAARENIQFSEVLSWKKPAFFFPIGIITFAIAIVISSLLFIRYTKTIEVTGYVVGHNAAVNVQSEIAGMIEKIYVNQGDFVSEGDPIALVKLTDFGKAKQDNDTEIEALKAILDQDSSLAKNNTSELKAQKAKIEKSVLELKSKQRATSQKQVILTNMQAVSESQFLLYEKLSATNAVSKVAYLDAKNRFLNSKFLLKQNQEEGYQISVEVSEMERQRMSIEHQLLAIPLAARKNEVAINRDIITRESENKILIKAPLSGEVSSITYKRNEIVSMGAIVAVVAPKQNSFSIDALVSAREIVFVEEGQAVTISFPALSNINFRNIKSKIVQIGSTPVPNINSTQINFSEKFYKLIVAVPSSTFNINGYELKLKPGMQLNVTIDIESRSLWGWLLAPYNPNRNFSLNF
jgi:membrane fusion protein